MIESVEPGRAVAPMTRRRLGIRRSLWLTLVMIPWTHSAIGQTPTSYLISEKTTLVEW
jgi:hypothetical protein